jgi:formylglycine-generating enzyme required for sulfatase activity
MVWIPGGTFWMGSEHGDMADARPRHLVQVDPYWIDATEVTNEEFARFVKATGYVTIAERKPDAKDFPGAPPENLVPGAMVFNPPRQPVALDDHYAWWSYVKGASWRHPEGPQSHLRGREKHPVVEVAWADAAAYAKWAGKRLPTEAEWEFASRGGKDRESYAWGNEMKPGGKHMANIWQGRFPDQNTGEDGYLATAPVASYPAEGYGLYDMGGNVWEWCADWYRADYYATLAAQGPLTVNPQGPMDSHDPAEPGVPKRVNKGGSFLCSDQYCSRYVLGSRGRSDPETGSANVGFRCVKPAPRG